MVRGTMTYAMPGSHIAIPERRLAIFWASYPHQVVSVDEFAEFYYVHVPLSLVLSWQLPDQLTHALLHGDVVIDQDDTNGDLDAAYFPRWNADTEHGDEQAKLTVRMELESRLRRVRWVDASAHKSSLGASRHERPIAASSKALDHIEKMTLYIAHNYAEDLKVDTIADHAGVHPKYAMALFRKNYGMTIMEYVTQHRISHAQRLLATSDIKIVDAAFEAGFGSISRFYEVFEKVCGSSPKEYRRSFFTGPRR